MSGEFRKDQILDFDYLARAATQIDTVVSANSLSGITYSNQIIFVDSTSTYYKYESSGAAYVIDSLYVLATADGGNTRWVSIAGRYFINRANELMFEPTGYSRNFPDTLGVLSFDQGTRTISLSVIPGQTSYSYMIAGKEHVKDVTSQLVISNVTGKHFVYFDTDEQLHELVNPTRFQIGDIVYQRAYTAFVYWNATTGKGRLYNERHGNKMDGETHANMHLTRGTQFIEGCEPSLVGVADGTGGLDSDAQIAIQDGLAADEDLPLVYTNGSPQTLGPIASVPVFHWSGIEWDWDAATNFPVKQFGTGRLAYNSYSGGLWGQTQVPNNQYVLAHIFGTNDFYEPIIAIQGQAAYNTINNARNGAVAEINSLYLTGLPSEEWFLIATFIYQTADIYTNTVKARIRTTGDGLNFVDWREEKLSPATAINIHNNLTGRDDVDAHPSSSISHTRIDAVVETVETSLARKEMLAGDSSEPTGYVNRSLTTLTWDHLTRTGTVAPTGASFDYWLKGYKVTITTPQAIQISTVDGLHYLYFDDSGSLFDDEHPPTDVLLSGVVFTQIVYWNNTQEIAIHVGDERHGMVMDWADHNYKHFVFGARYVSGLALDNFTIGDGSLDAHAQLDCADGVIKDEDIEHVITNGSPQTLTPTAQIPVFYRVGAANLWYRTEADNFPIIYSGKQGYVAGAVTTIYTGANLRPAYNQDIVGTWQLTEVGQGDFFLIHLFATNDIYYPIIALLGINVYTKEKDAQDAAYTEIQSLTGLPFVEFTPIGSVIYEGNNTFANSVNARIIPTDTGANYIDFRDTRTFKGTTGPIPTLRNGDYTATYTNIANTTGAVVNPFYYFGIGPELDIRGEMQITTAAAGATQFRMTLPVATLLGFTYELSGSGSEATGAFPVAIYGDTTNHEALFSFTSLAATTYTIHFKFGYRIQ